MKNGPLNELFSSSKFDFIRESRMLFVTHRNVHLFFMHLNSFELFHMDAVRCTPRVCAFGIFIDIGSIQIFCRF